VERVQGSKKKELDNVSIKYFVNPAFGGIFFAHIVPSCQQKPLNLCCIKNYFMLSNSAFLLAMPGGSEWIFIIIAVLIMFGGRKIPEFMRGLGKGIREFNDAKSNVKKEIEEGMQEKDKQVNS
jgi:sec-independent protein translocase protein TatA